MASNLMASLLRLRQSPAITRTAGSLISFGQQHASTTFRPFSLRPALIARPNLVRFFSNAPTDEDGLPQVDDAAAGKYPPLYYTLRGQLKDALASNDTVRATVLRAIFNEVDYRTSGGRRSLANNAHLAGLMLSIKTRSEEARDHFASQNRQELADKENSQITVLEEFIDMSGAKVADEQQIRAALEEALSGNRPGMVPNVRWLKSRVASILGDYMLNQEKLAMIADEFVPKNQQRYTPRQSRL